MELISDNLLFFALGLAHTLQLAVVTLICSTVLGVALGGIASLDHVVPKLVVHAYVNVLRGIPLIVNVLFVYFVAPIFGLALNGFTAAAVSLSLWGGANCAEIVRGGLQGVARGQREAARALALPWLVSFRKIILPQALRPIIPALAGLFTLLVQSTALGSLVGVPELFRNAGIVVERAAIEHGGSPAFIVYGAVLLTYFVVCSLLTRMTRQLERRYRPEQRRPRTQRPTVAASSTVWQDA